MLGSDKHHICLKGTNINDPYSSYHKRVCNDRAYYQENIKVSDIVTSHGRSKQTIWVLKKMKIKKTSSLV